MRSAYEMFPTALGPCGIAWNDRGITRVQLPERDRERTEDRLRELAGNAERARPPSWVKRTMDRIKRHLGGRMEDLSEARIDTDGLPDFHRRIYDLARAIPPGRAVTYGELAALAGSPGATRAVGQAMARNPVPLLVPCHRVLGSGRRLNGFSAFGGCGTKARLLALEGVTIPENGSPSLFAGSRELGFDERDAIRHLMGVDRTLSGLIRRVGEFRLRPQALQSPFEALGEAIIYQQLTGKAAETILGRFKALFGGRRFPAPEDVIAATDGRIRSAGLSRAKTAALRDLAEKTLSGVVPPLRVLRRMGDREIVDRLTVIRGIGVWTVEMMLIFRLGRPDVLPVHDYGVRKGFAKVYRRRELPAPADLARHGEKWRPYRSVASWYLWRALD